MGDFWVPYYSFDLVIGEEYKDQGGLILENLEVAADRADQLAVELSIVRPELKVIGCAVRVIGAGNTELYRTPINPIPSWMRCQNSSVGSDSR